MDPNRVIVDLSELPLDELFGIDDAGQITDAVRQVLADAATPRTPLGAFNSVIDN